MISAIHPTDNKTSFTSVIPVKVIVDNKEVYSEKLVRPAVLKLASFLTGPAKNSALYTKIVKKFGLVDPDYSILKGMNGYPPTYGKKKAQPSDYFRYIFKKHAHYLLTGPQAKKVREEGRAIGIERKAAKQRGETESLDVKAAQANYFETINKFIRDKSLRLTESFNPDSKERQGATVSLVLHLTSNRKYGQKDYAMFIDDISFTKSS